MVYSEAAKRATYKYRLKVKETENYKGKVSEYSARSWEILKADVERLEKKRAGDRKAYFEQLQRGTGFSANTTDQLVWLTSFRSRGYLHRNAETRSRCSKSSYSSIKTLGVGRMSARIQA